MAHIYSLATDVLVIDKSIQWMTASNSAPLERLFYASVFSWTRRLWTLQEGWLAQMGMVSFDFNDGPVAWWDLVNAWVWGETPRSLKAFDFGHFSKEHAALATKLRKALGLDPYRRLEDLSRAMNSGLRTNRFQNPRSGVSHTRR